MSGALGRRIINVEAMQAGGPGFVLDVFEASASTYRGEVRDPEERIVLAIASARLDGAASLLESVVTFFAAGPHADVGKELVEGARLELELCGHDATPEDVSGLQVSGLVMEALSPLRDAWPDIGVDALADALGEIAAKCAVELHRRFLIQERT